MEHFWAGFEKQALLGSLARGAGYVLGAGRQTVKNIGGLAKNFSAAGGVKGVAANTADKVKRTYQEGLIAGHRAVRGKKPVTAATPTPVAPTPGKVRAAGKNLLTGGLLGAGGVYMAGSSGQPSQPSPY